MIDQDDKGVMSDKDAQLQNVRSMLETFEQSQFANGERSQRLLQFSNVELSKLTLEVSHPLNALISDSFSHP